MANNTSFSFSNQNISVSSGEIFTVDVMMYSSEKPIVSFDAYLLYDPNILSPKNLSDLGQGSLFNDIGAKIISPGKIYLYGINDATIKEESIGKIATLNFEAIQTGSTRISFDCDELSKESYAVIVDDENLSNVINCTATNTHSLPVMVKEANGSSVLGADTSYKDVNYSLILIGVFIIVAAFAFAIKYKNKFFSK